MNLPQCSLKATLTNSYNQISTNMQNSDLLLRMVKIFLLYLQISFSELFHILNSKLL